MIAKKYGLTFTENSRYFMNLLMESGYNIRDVLNAGVIMFYKARQEDRGVALAEATGRQEPDLKALIERLNKVTADVNLKMLSSEDAALVEQIRRVFGPQSAQSSVDAIADEAAAADSAAGRSGKADQTHRGAG